MSRSGQPRRDSGMPSRSERHRGGGPVLLTGTSHPELAKAIADRLGVDLCPADVGHFSAGETSVQLKKSVRDQDVFVISSPSPPAIDDHVMETLVLLHTCRMASARRITVVMPHFPYGREAGQGSSRGGMTAKLLARLLQTAGASHVISMDVHSQQIQGFFDVPMDNLSMTPLFKDWIKSNIPDWRNMVIISPDASGTKRASELADRLGVELAIINRKRSASSRTSSTICGTSSSAVSEASHSVSGSPAMVPNGSYVTFGAASGIHSSPLSRVVTRSSAEDDEVDFELLIGDVKGKSVCIVDDMVETGRTLALAVRVLRQAGASQIYAAIAHGLLCPATVTKISDLDLKRIAFANTVRMGSHADDLGRARSLIDVAPIIAESIRRTHNGESLSQLFALERADLPEMEMLAV